MKNICKISFDIHVLKIETDFHERFNVFMQVRNHNILICQYRNHLLDILKMIFNVFLVNNFLFKYV